MNSRVRVLVLGVGGNVGQGIIKSLRKSVLPVHITAACLDDSAAGLYLADEYCLSPPAAAPEFPDWLASQCVSRSIQAVLSGAEPVIDKLSALTANLERFTPARAIVSTPEVLKVSNDKQLTCEWLAKNGFNAPSSARATNSEAVETLVDRFGFDLIAKPACGKGSQGIFQIASKTDLEQCIKRDDYIIQESVGSDEHEYTVATMSDREGNVQGVVAMKRLLRHGTSVFTEFVNHPALCQTAASIADRLQPMGPCNMQFRVVGERLACFEINVRFSGTAPIRAHFGFNDVEAAIRHFVLEEPMRKLPSVKSGRAIRYWNEVYPDIQ